jgi:GT2 family glycosyltransferase
MKTAVVILNWNTEGFLKEFLPGLIRSVEKIEGAEVIVADNASTDGSLEVMKTMFPQVRTIVFEKNFGFTGGYNKAFDQIDSDLFVLINSDIEVTEGWLEPLVEWMERHPDCGACAPKLHSWQEREKFEYAGAAGGYIDKYGYPFCRGRVMKHLETDHGQYDSPADVFWATGACLMVRSSLYKKLGGLDERFFAHMEEIDLCWRMQLEGYKVTVVPESMVYHVGGGTLPATSPFKLYLNFRNNLLMLENNLAKTYAIAFMNQGLPAEKAASKGLKKASARIRFRKCLDGLSAAVYLLTLRTDCLKSVWKAHKDAAGMIKRPGRQEIAGYLKTGKGHVTGIYRKWIILSSVLKGDKISESIQGKDFYNI